MTDTVQENLIVAGSNATNAASAPAVTAPIVPPAAAEAPREAIATPLPVVDVRGPIDAGIIKMGGDTKIELVQDGDRKAPDPRFAKRRERLRARKIERKDYERRTEAYGRPNVNVPERFVYRGEPTVAPPMETKTADAPEDAAVKGEQ